LPWRLLSARRWHAKPDLGRRSRSRPAAAKRAANGGGLEGDRRPRNNALTIGGHRTSDSVRHVKFRRRHIKASLLSNRMVSSVINRHEQRVFLPVPWFSPRSRQRSPHDGVRKLRGFQCNTRSPVHSNSQAVRNAKSPAASSRQGTRLSLDQQRILAMVLALRRLWASPWRPRSTIETLRRWSTSDA
jgi:hypothetical protein